MYMCMYQYIISCIFNSRFFQGFHCSYVDQLQSITGPIVVADVEQPSDIWPWLPQRFPNLRGWILLGGQFGERLSLGNRMCWRYPAWEIKNVYKFICSKFCFSLKWQQIARKSVFYPVRADNLCGTYQSSFTEHSEAHGWQTAHCTQTRHTVLT